MGTRQRPKKWKADGINFDSKEEMEFYHWLCEAKEHGLVETFSYHPYSFKLYDGLKYTQVIQLKTKTKTRERTLLKPHVYTPDYMVLPVKGSLLDGNSIFRRVDEEHPFIIEVKGMYLQNERFPLNQKWVHQIHGIYVDKVVPQKLFLKTWVPAKCLITPHTGKPCATWHLTYGRRAVNQRKEGVRDIGEFMKTWKS
jgi:hypothetical protein